MTSQGKKHAGQEPPRPLSEEIDILRDSIHTLYMQLMACSDLGQAARAVQALSSALGRLAQLTNAEAQLKQGKEDVEAAFWKAFAETIQEMGFDEQNK